VDVKVLANENPIFCDGRYTSLGNLTYLFPSSDSLGGLWRMKVFQFGILMANPCASSLSSPFSNLSHIKSQIS
jgi:hypothetical protein